MAHQLIVVSSLEVNDLAAFHGVVVAAIKEIEVNTERFLANFGKHHGRDDFAADSLLLDDDGRVVVYISINLVQSLMRDDQDIFQRGGLACRITRGSRFANGRVRRLPPTEPEVANSRHENQDQY